MKKRLIVVALTVVVAVGVTFVIVSHQKRSYLAYLERLTRIPESKPHQHVAPSGEIVEHIHTYDTPESEVSTEKTTSSNVAKNTDTKDYMKENAIQRIWSNLDLEAIREEFQPYTLEEMHEKWKNHWFVPRPEATKELDNFRNRDKWLQRLMDLGYPFLRVGHYQNALSTRRGLKISHDSENPTASLHDRVGLPPEATWEEGEDLYMKHRVIAELAFEREYQADPESFAGGVFNISDVGQGVLTPFKENTVYVHVSDDKPFSQITGAKLTAEEETALTVFGIPPRGMKVIYTDKNGMPLTADHKPRFYERAMEGLDRAEKHIEKMIADHDALFNQPENETQQETKPIVVDTQHDRPHPHEVESPPDKAQQPDVQRKLPPQVGKNRQPPLPPKPPSPEQVQEWFEELILLHGGDLPKDLKALQEVIKELEAIRKIGKEMAPPRPLERPAPRIIHHRSNEVHPDIHLYCFHSVYLRRGTVILET